MVSNSHWLRIVSQKPVGVALMKAAFCYGGTGLLSKRRRKPKGEGEDLFPLALLRKGG